MNHDPFDTLAAVYALDALDGEELVEFQAHLAQGCTRCAATLRESHEALAALAVSALPAVPPPEVKQALVSRVAAAAPPSASRRTRARGRIPWIVGAAAAAVVAAAFTGAFVAGHYEARLGHMARELAATRERLQREVAALNDQLAVYRSAADLLRDPATQVVTLRGLGPGPRATGRVIWHQAAGGQLLVANLPPAPPGKAYELWTIGEGAPRPAGVFRVDAAGRATHRVEPVEGGKPVKVFAVTLEPEHGVPAPTGPMVLASAQ
ncbi:MAG TPA: anti-sigma factor [Candidatus Limnocylindria bacterium]|jgi:anti-sigma-K factor RskA|nr:anti-sigma factor [Candidatus Limnocylindria bacterium]